MVPLLACDRVTRVEGGNCACDLVTLLVGGGDGMEADGTGELVASAAIGLPSGITSSYRCVLFRFSVSSAFSSSGFLSGVFRRLMGAARLLSSSVFLSSSSSEILASFGRLRSVRPLPFCC